MSCGWCGGGWRGGSWCLVGEGVVIGVVMGGGCGGELNVGGRCGGGESW